MPYLVSGQVEVKYLMNSFRHLHRVGHGAFLSANTVVHSVRTFQTLRAQHRGFGLVLDHPLSGQSTHVLGASLGFLGFVHRPEIREIVKWLCK